MTEHKNELDPEVRTAEENEGGVGGQHSGLGEGGKDRTAGTGGTVSETEDFDVTTVIEAEKERVLALPLNERFAEFDDNAGASDDEADDDGDGDSASAPASAPASASEGQPAAVENPYYKPPKSYYTPPESYYTPKQTTVVEPKGSSPATIVLGIFALVIGLATLFVGLVQPVNILAGVTPNEFFAWMLAGIGVIFALVAIIWGISNAIHKRHDRS